MNNVSKKRERVGALLCTPRRLRSVLGPHSLGRTGEQGGKRRVFFSFSFFFPPPLHFRKTENDLSKAMIQGYVMDGFVLLCLSIFHSFLRCHSLCFFSLRKAIISITLHISAKFAVSVHAWPKGRKSHSVGVEFHFLARTYCFLWFARGVELQCDILFFFFLFLTAHTRYSEGTAATAVIEILIRNKCVYMRLPPLRRWPADCGGVFPRMHLNETNNGSSVLDHRKKKTKKKKIQERLDYLINQSG